MSHSSYLNSALLASARNEAMTEALEFFRSCGIAFDSFAVRGASGMVFGGALAHALQKDVIVVRKGEKCHGMAIEVPPTCAKFMVVDDMVCTGYTVREILAAVHQYNADATRTTNPLRCEGVYLYADSPKFRQAPANEFF